MKLFTVNWNGAQIPAGDTNQWPPDAQTFGTPQVSQPVFNGKPNPPQALVVAGSSASTADPSNDANRKALGLVPITGVSIVFGNY